MCYLILYFTLGLYWAICVIYFVCVVAVCSFNRVSKYTLYITRSLSYLHTSIYIFIYIVHFYLFMLWLCLFDFITQLLVPPNYVLKKYFIGNLSVFDKGRTFFKKILPISWAIASEILKNVPWEALNKLFYCCCK